jgi:Alcohol dehydrogenase GroES-associated
MNLLVHTSLKAFGDEGVTWHGKRDARVDAVPDPEAEEPTGAIA